MRKIKALVFIMAAAMCTLSLTGCVTFDNFKAAFIDKPQDKEATIQIGVFEPVTGSDSAAAEAEIRGIQLANEVHPNVNGKVVELVFSDNKSDIDAAETAIQTLLVKEPAVILGSYGSVYSLAAGQYIEDAKIPAIAITNTNPLVTKNNDYYYRVCYVDSNQGDLLAQYILDKGEETAGVLLPSNDDAALAMATEFTDRIKEETENEDAITLYEEYTPGSKDYTDQLKAVRRSGVDSIILPGDYQDAAVIINQAAEMDLDVEFLGDRDWNEADFNDLLDEDVESSDVAFVSFFASDDSAVEGLGSQDNDENAVSEERERFLDAYHKANGQDSEPEDAVALGYDAYLVALDAIDKAGDDVSSEAINKLLADPTYSFDGASGDINFSSTGDPIKTAYISTWEEGRVVTLHTIEPVK